MNPPTLPSQTVAALDPSVGRSFDLYLASQSPRRRQLLDQLGVRYQLLLPDDQEDAESLELERAGEAPQDYVLRVTLAKLAAAVERRHRRWQADPAAWPERPVLCSDTTVALGLQILGKPADAEDALRTLRLLSGKSHQVLTAVAVQTGDALDQRLSISEVEFADLPEPVLQAYVASGEPFGKAGAYAIQSALAGWIPRVSGSYSSIMGLPLFETARLLQAAGVPTGLTPCTTS